MRCLCVLVWLIPALLCRAEGVAETRVLLLPFELAGPASANWLPDALRQNMLHEMARSSRLVLLSPKDVAVAGDAVAARAAGRTHSAHLVIFGACQVVENEVRLIGHVLDVSSGKMVGVIRLTGSMRDVFGLEDQFAERCKRLSLEAAQAQQPKADPVMAFARNLEKPLPAIKPEDPLRRGPWPWEIDHPEVRWARENVIYGRRSSTEYYGYPMFPMGAAYATPGYGGFNFGRGWLGHPLTTTTYNGITFSRSYQSATSLTWGATYYFPNGVIRVNTGW